MSVTGPISGADKIKTAMDMILEQANTIKDGWKTEKWLKPLYDELARIDSSYLSVGKKNEQMEVAFWKAFSAAENAVLSSREPESLNAGIALRIIQDVSNKLNISPPDISLEQPQAASNIDESTSNRLLKVSDDEWEEAEAFFNKNPNETKLAREKYAGKENDHSFIKIEGTIYAMAHAEQFGAGKHGNYLGEGAFGKVKIAQERNGNAYALKIQGAESNALQEERITRAIGYLKGKGSKKLSEKKKFNKGEITQKEYLVTELRKGKELFNEINESYGNHYTRRKEYDGKENMDSRMIMAAKCCQSIHELHQQKILHCDIKPPNFMFNREGEQIIIGAIDFGFSKRLPLGQNQIVLGKAVGTLGYIAPEIAAFAKNYGKLEMTSEKGIYSPASDVYALGMMLKKDFGLEPKFYKDMIHKDPKKRISLPKAIERLNNALKTEYPNSPVAKAYFEELNQKSAKRKEPVTIAAANNQEKPTALGILSTDLRFQYDQLYSKKHDNQDEHSFLSMYQKAKSATRGIRGVDKERQKQLDNIQTVFDNLKKTLTANSDIYQTAYALKVAYAQLETVKNSLSKESSLNKLCEKLQNDIVKALPANDKKNNFKDSIYTEGAQNILTTQKNEQTPKGKNKF